jgi:DNA-binding NarL/FixJ family response regulator
MELEQEVVQLVMFCASDHQIIAYLTSSQQIVKQYFSNIYQKLNAKSKIELIILIDKVQNEKDITFLTFK